MSGSVSSGVDLRAGGGRSPGRRRCDPARSPVGSIRAINSSCGTSSRDDGLQRPGRLSTAARSRRLRPDGTLRGKPSSTKPSVPSSRSSINSIIARPGPAHRDPCSALARLPRSVDPRSISVSSRSLAMICGDARLSAEATGRLAYPSRRRAVRASRSAYGQCMRPSTRRPNGRRTCPRSPLPDVLYTSLRVHPHRSRRRRRARPRQQRVLVRDDFRPACRVPGVQRGAGRRGGDDARRRRPGRRLVRPAAAAVAGGLARSASSWPETARRPPHRRTASTTSRPRWRTSAARASGWSTNAPRHGSMGASIAFLHPKDTGGVLTELVQARPALTFMAGSRNLGGIGCRRSTAPARLVRGSPRIGRTHRRTVGSLRPDSAPVPMRAPLEAALLAEQLFPSTREREGIVRFPGELTVERIEGRPRTRRRRDGGQSRAIDQVPGEDYREGSRALDPRTRRRASRRPRPRSGR